MAAVLWEKLRTARDWGQLPSAVGICSPAEDLALMTAYTNSQSLMAAYEYELTRPKPTPDGGKGKRKRK